MTQGSPIVFTDRYSVFGPPSKCKGQCEGTGMVPVWPSSGFFDGKDDESIHYREAWRAAEAKSPTRGSGVDRTHFVNCYDCGGRHK